MKLLDKLFKQKQPNHEEKMIRELMKKDFEDAVNEDNGTPCPTKDDLSKLTNLDNKLLKEVLRDGKTLEQHIKEGYKSTMIKLDGSTIVARTLTNHEIEFMYLIFKEAADYGYADMIRYELKSNKSITFLKRSEYLGRVKLNGRKMYVGKIEGGTLDVSSAEEAFQYFFYS